MPFDDQFLGRARRAHKNAFKELSKNRPDPDYTTRLLIIGQRTRTIAGIGRTGCKCTVVQLERTLPTWCDGYIKG